MPATASQGWPKASLQPGKDLDWCLWLHSRSFCCVKPSPGNLPFRKISLLLDVSAQTVWLGSLFSFSVSLFISEKEDFLQMSWISLSLTFKPRNRLISFTILGRSWGTRKMKLLYFWADYQTSSWYENDLFYYLSNLSHIYLLSNKARHVIRLCRWQVQ